MKKNILIGITALLMTGIILASAVSIFAGEINDPHSSLINRIVKKFNLKKEDVRQVFEEERVERQKQMEQRNEDRLNQLVKDGKITDAQKKLIQAKQNELQTKRESEKSSLKNLTREERKTKIEEERKSLEEWATKNGIDLKYLMLGRGGHGMKLRFERIKP